MKKSTFVGTLAAALLLTGSASAAKKHFKAFLDWEHEVTVPSHDGKNPTGEGEFIYDDTTKVLCGKITWNDLTGAPTGIHLHSAPVGMPDSDGVAPKQGKMIIQLPAATASSVTFALKIDFKGENGAAERTFEDALLAEEMYANVHTALNPKGEARSTLFEFGDPLPNITCPTTLGNPDGGAPGVGNPPDAGASSSGSTSSTSSTSSTGGPGGSTSSSSTSSSSGDGTDAGSEDTTKPEAEKSGCSTAGSPTGALSFAFVVGVGIVLVSSRMRRKRS